jgi:WD40 repeat protein
MRWLAWIIAVPSLLAEDPVSFQKQIRPILVRSCVGCHQPASKQAGLMLTSHDDFLKGGSKGAAVVPGDAAKSIVLGYLDGTLQPRMPFGGKPLPDDQIQLMKRWIVEGAKDDSPAGVAGTAVRKPTVYFQPPMVTALAFSPDGSLLAVSGHHETLLLNPEGILQARLPGLSMRINSLAFSPDGTLLAAVGGDPASMGELQIWNVKERKPLHSVVASNDTFFGVSFSPDGKKIAFAGADKSIRIYDSATGKEIRRADHHEDWVFATVFGIDGKRIVSVGRDRAAKLTDVETGRFIENINLLKEPLTAIAAYPRRDWVAIGGAERIPYLYRMDRPRAMRIADDSTLIRKFEKMDGPILSLAISNDALWLAAGAEAGDVRIYNLETGETAAHCKGHEGGIYALQFHPDGKRLFTGGFDGTIRVYDTTGKLLNSFSPVPITKKAPK